MDVPDLDVSNLNSDDRDVRLKAAREIVRILRAETETRSDGHNLYIIFKRVIRGLGDLTSRRGYFSSLVGYLSLFPQRFDITVFLKIIESEVPAGSNTNQEKEETYLGQILAYGSLIMTDLILSAPEEVKKNIFDKLFQLSRLSSCLHHASFLYMSKILKKAEKEFIPDGFIDDIKNLNDNPLDKLNYLLTLNGKCFRTTTMTSALETESFFDLTNVSKIIDILKKSKTSVMLGHSFIVEFSSTICCYPGFFLLFWSTLINLEEPVSRKTDLLKPSSNDDTVTLELSRHLLKACFKYGNLELRKSLWTKSFVCLLMQNVRKNRKAVQAILNEFCTCIKSEDDHVNLRVLQVTLFDLGVLDFDVLTGTKTISLLMNHLSFNGLRAVAHAYKAIIENRKKIISIGEGDKTIHTSINNYTKLINSRTCYHRTKWRFMQLIYLMTLGFRKQSHIQLNRELIKHAQIAFLSSLGHLCTNLKSFQNAFDRILLVLDKLLDENREDLLIKFTDEMYETWKKSASLNKLLMSKFIDNESCSKRERELLSILKFLLQYMSLLMFMEPCISFINILYLNSIFVELKKENKTIWIEIIIDIFLNVLSIKIDHHRFIFTCIFKSLRSHLTVESFNQIVDVLKLSYDPPNLIDIYRDDRLNESVNLYYDYEQEEKCALKYQYHLANFRIRVIDLIEICTEIDLPFSYWLSAAIPLIDLYGAIRQKPLDNLKSIIHSCIKKLNLSKVTLENDSIKEAVTVLNELFKKISKSIGVYSDLKTDLIFMIRFILRTSESFSEGLEEEQLTKNEIFQIFKRYFEDFFHSKNSVPVNLFNSVISFAWDGILALIPILMHFIFDNDLKVHKRMLGIKMIKIFIKTPEFFDGHLESYYQLYLTKSTEIFIASFTDAIEKVCFGKTLNEKFYSELWSCLFVILNKQADDNEFPQIINRKKVKLLLSTKYQIIAIMKDQCKQNFEKLCNFLQINVTNAKETNSQKCDAKEDSGMQNIGKRKNNNDLEGGMEKKLKIDVVLSN